MGLTCLKMRVKKQINQKNIQSLKITLGKYLEIKHDEKRHTLSITEDRLRVALAQMGKVVWI